MSTSLLSLTLLSVICGFGEGSAESLSEMERCETHFKMKLVSLDGEWESYVHYASEDATAVLPDDNCEKVTWFQQASDAKSLEQIQKPMTVDTSKSVLVGHQNGDYKDFFQVLTVTMTQMPNDTHPDHFLKHDTLSPPPKLCVFYIGAKGAGMPVLYTHGFHNASCTLKDPIIGPMILTAK